jgi:hypothetical protein
LIRSHSTETGSPDARFAHWFFLHVLGHVADMPTLREQGRRYKLKLIEDARDGLRTCPPILKYGGKLQAQAAMELALLPDGSSDLPALSSHTVIRD